MGHSEGSGWAICMDEFMQQRKLPNQRILLGTGPRMVPQEMAKTLIASQRPMLFLQSGLIEPAGIEEITDYSFFDLFTFQGDQVYSFFIHFYPNLEIHLQTCNTSTVHF